MILILFFNSQYSILLIDFAILTQKYRYYIQVIFIYLKNIFFLIGTYLDPDLILKLVFGRTRILFSNQDPAGSRFKKGLIRSVLDTVSSKSLIRNSPTRQGLNFLDPARRLRTLPVPRLSVTVMVKNDRKKEKLPTRGKCQLL